MKKIFLLLFFPLWVFAAIPATTVWEIRSGGSDNNGGGYGFSHLGRHRYGL